jgi:hypothetical protein
MERTLELETAHSSASCLVPLSVPPLDTRWAQTSTVRSSELCSALQ